VPGSHSSLGYSPDLSPPDYFLFSKLKKKLKGLHFVNVAEIQEAVTDELKKVQKEEFSAAFQKLYDHAEVCIYVIGAYFEFKKKYVSSIFKKSVLKLLYCCVCIWMLFQNFNYQLIAKFVLAYFTG
jgi:hypothetical protein